MKSMKCGAIILSFCLLLCLEFAKCQEKDWIADLQEELKKEKARKDVQGLTEFDLKWQQVADINLANFGWYWGNYRIIKAKHNDECVVIHDKEIVFASDDFVRCYDVRTANIESGDITLWVGDEDRPIPEVLVVNHVPYNSSYVMQIATDPPPDTGRPRTIDRKHTEIESINDLFYFKSYSIDKYLKPEQHSRLQLYATFSSEPTLEQVGNVMVNVSFLFDSGTQTPYLIPIIFDSLFKSGIYAVTYYPQQVIAYFGNEIVHFQKSRDYFIDYNLFGLETSNKIDVAFNINKQKFFFQPPLSWDTYYMESVLLNTDGNVVEEPTKASKARKLRKELDEMFEQLA